MAMSRGNKAKNTFFKYSQEDLLEAVRAKGQRGEMKIRESEGRFTVPLSTLINKLKQTTKMEPETVIPKIGENVLELFLISSAKKGFPVSKRRLLTVAQKISKKTPKMF